MSTLGHALLGLLADGPRTGYQLARRMERPIGYFWTAQHSQIYPQLARLEADGLVRHRVVDGPGPRDTKQYRITAAGRAALRAWVDTPVPPQPGRSELMLRVRSLWMVEPARARAFVEQVRAEHAATLETYRAEGATFDQDEVALGIGSPTFGAWATLRQGLGHEEQVLAWCDWLLAEIDRTTDRTADRTADRAADHAADRTAPGHDEGPVTR
ncbi:PadR family transcriptional regulator [Angustibacter peucedani]